MWDNDFYTPSQLITISLLLLVLLFTRPINKAYAETSPSYTKCAQPLAADWLKKIDTALSSNGSYAAYGQYHYGNSGTKAILLKSTNGSVNRIIMFNEGMTMTVSGSPPASLQIAYANNSGTNITFFDLRPNADGTAFTVGSAGPILNGTTLIYNPVCIDQIKGSVENNNPVGGGTLNDLWPAEPGFAWTGLNFVPPPPPPPPEPNTELTLRDEKLIAIEITLGLIYILTKPFVFRQHE